MGIQDADYQAYLDGKLTEEDLLIIANAFEMYQAAGGSGNWAYMYQNEAQDWAAKIREKYDPNYIKNDSYDYTHGGRYNPNSVEPMPGPPRHKIWTKLTTIEEQDGNQAVQASGEGDTAEEPSLDDLLDAVMTPEQRFQRAKITSLIIGWLSKEQKRRIENGEDFDAIINELDSWQIDRIEHSIDKSGALDSQQHRDFMLLSGGVFRDVALPERLAILQVLKEKAGEITADDLIGLAADALGEEVAGGYFEQLNHTPLNRTLLNEFASLLVLAYHGIENGITLEAMNAEYMAQKQAEGSSLATAMFATAVGAAVARKMFLTPGKIPGGQQGAMGNSEGSQSPGKPPEVAGNPGGPAAGAGEIISRETLPNPTFTTEKLQHEYKHAGDFGVNGNWNKSAGEAYQSVIQNHFTTSTDIFKSTYRGQDVFVYINKNTGIGAYTDLSGGYIGGWKFSPEQIEFHFTNGIRIN